MSQSFCLPGTTIFINGFPIQLDMSTSGYTIQTVIGTSDSRHGLATLTRLCNTSFHVGVGRVLELFEPFTDVPMPYKSKCYNPRAYSRKARKTYTCSDRIRGNYY